MHYLLKLFLLAIIVACQGCQLISEYIPISSEFSDSPSLTHQLLSQSLRHEKLSNILKKEKCQSLKQQHKNNPDWKIAWLLAFPSNENFNCISLKEKLVLLESIKKTPELSPQILWLNNNQLYLFKKLQKLQTVQNKVYKFKRKNNHLKNQLNEAEEQLQQVISKIQALKAIETNINKKLDDEHSNGY